MKLTKKQLLGVNITVNTKKETLSVIEEYIHGGSEAVKKSPFVIATPNPEQLIAGMKDESFRLVLNRADVALPDGVGVVFGLKVLRGVLLNRISGIDFMSDLVRMANKNNYSIGLVGGKNGTGKKALAELKSSYVNLSGWAIEPEEMNEKKLAKHIADSNTKIVFVGLGAPKQEYFIDVLKKEIIRLQPSAFRLILMSVGGSFDMIAGRVPRAPLWMQKGGLEWIYRLFHEPWRWKRQLALIRFFFIIIWTVITR
ncbi:MAG: WecB/TagA/CpsF family glycosyltransferase [Candidatus Gottesmanbacteria bacterium]